MEFRYSLNPWFKVIAVMVCGGAAYLLVYIGLNVENGIVLFKVIRLGEFGAKVFFFSWAALSLLAGIIGWNSIWETLGRPGKIVLTDVDITAPENPARVATVTIKYVDIGEVKRLELLDQLYLEISYPTGALLIQSDPMKNKATFHQFERELASRIEKSYPERRRRKYMQKLVSKQSLPQRSNGSKMT